MAKRKNGPPWWATTLLSTVSSFGFGFLTGLGSGMKPGQAATVAGAAALAPLVGVPVAASYNADGSPAEQPFRKTGKSDE